ncbi:MAG: type II toxin-antitoxin system Phd/YefM family antitoxin, partial [Boseongicola sp.]
MGKALRAARASLAVVTTTAFRRRLAHYVGRVRHGGDFIAIERKGEENVYLISQADWDLLDVKIAEVE